MRIKADVAVFGAGSSGSAVAWNLARSGRKVVLLEKRALDKSGARWINGIPAWVFDYAGLERPKGDELIDTGVLTHFITKDGREKVIMDDNPMWNVDMDLLIRRLHGLCEKAGVRIFEHVHLAAERDEWTEKPRITKVDCIVKPPDEMPYALEVEAKLFVDATGIAGALRDKTHLLGCSEVLRGLNLCSAIQVLAKINDKKAARAFLANYGAKPGEVVNWLGTNGGYSTASCSIGEDLEEAHMVFGALVHKRFLKGPQMYENFRAREAWLGEELKTGIGTIPLRHPCKLLATQGVALVGDSGCMVYNAHGSGVGMGFVAGKILAETTARFTDCGCNEALWAYNRSFQMSYGNRLAALDVMREFFHSLSGEEVDMLMKSGLMTATTIRNGLNQEAPKASMEEIRNLPKALAKAPKLLAKMLPAIVKTQIIMQHYSRYPKEPGKDFRAYYKWVGKINKMFERWEKNL